MIIIVMLDFIDMDREMELLMVYHDCAVFSLWFGWFMNHIHFSLLINLRMGDANTELGKWRIDNWNGIHF